jgi:hypothetical protein
MTSEGFYYVHTDGTNICFQCEGGDHKKCLLVGCDCDNDQDIEGI